MERTPHHTIAKRPRASRRSALLLAVTAVGVVAACSGPAAPVGSTSRPATTPAAALTLSVTSNPEVGTYVAGASGLALYVFLSDSEGKSTCAGECAESWPPLAVTAAANVAAGSGVTGAIGSITRDDGTMQVTLGGAPLYYFAADTAAGDVKGQGIGAVWYLASPSGGPVQLAAASPGGGPSPTPCVGRYCY